MINDNEKSLLNISPGLRDIETQNIIKLQNRYSAVIEKLQLLFNTYSDKNSFDDKAKTNILAKKIFEFEAELKLLNDKKTNHLTLNSKLNDVQIYKAREEAEANYLAAKSLAKMYLNLKESNKQGAIANQKNADLKQPNINDICERYAMNNPDKLSKEHCKRPAKQDLIQLIMNESYIGETTAKKRRKIAFSQLGYPEEITK